MLRLALLLSITIHLAVTTLLFNQTRQTTPQSEQPQIVSVTYKEVATPPASNSTRKRKQRTIPLAALSPKWNFQPIDANQPIDEATLDTPSSWTESQTYDTPAVSSGLSVGEENFAHSLWRMIDQHIEENPFLSEYNRTGKVFLRFDVDQAGKLHNLQAKAVDKVLKVIAARAVRKAIRNETGDVRFPPKRMSINARFSWSSHQACQTLRGVRGNQLSFCHYAENKRKNFSSGEEVAVWAGAIWNYGPWAYEEINKYNREESRRKTQFNPFRLHELDPDWNL